MQLKENCGIRPDLDDVRAFLQNQRLSATQELTPKPSPLPTPRETKATTPKSASRGGKIIGFVLDGRQQDCGSGNKALSDILIEFQRRDHTFMARLAPRTIGRNRRLVAQNPNDIYENEDLKEMVRDLKNGWWMGTNISTGVIKGHIETACEVAGVAYGSELVLLER